MHPSSIIPSFLFSNSNGKKGPKGNGWEENKSNNWKFAYFQKLVPIQLSYKKYKHSRHTDVCVPFQQASALSVGPF